MYLIRENGGLDNKKKIMKQFDYNKYLKNNPLLKESINEIAEAATSELKLKGPDQDELIDAIAFLNNGIGKGNQKVKLPFGNNTLKALDKDGKKDGAAFSIRVKPSKSGAEYIKSVNDFLDDHGFGCKLTGAKVNEAIGQENNYKKAALELVTLAKNLISRAGESLVMNSEVKKASMITDEDGLSKLYYHLQDVLGELIGTGGRAFAREAKKIIVDKYNIEMTDEYGFPMKWMKEGINESTTLNEAFAANSKLANALLFMKKNAENVYQDEPEIMSAMADVKASGLTSRDVFSFASMFPRDSFKVDDIRTGKLEAQVDFIHFDGSEMLNKAKALRSFLLAFDNYYHGDKNWYKGY
jgi:hypothetical protein